MNLSLEQAVSDMAKNNDPALFAGLTETDLPSQDARSRYAVNVAGCVTSIFREGFLEGRTNIVKLPRFSKVQDWHPRITGWAFSRFLASLSNLSGGRLVLDTINSTYVSSVLESRSPGLGELIPRDESSILQQSSLDAKSLRVLEKIVEDCNLKFSSSFENQTERLVWVTVSAAASLQGFEKALTKYSEYFPIDVGTAGLFGPLQ